MQEDIIKLANVSPEVAGKFLGKSAQFIRCGLQIGSVFGVDHTTILDIYYGRTYKQLGGQTQ